MTEPRRIETTSASIAAAAVGSVGAKTVPTTVRLSVPLTESTDDAYPEFSYVELLYRNSGTLQGSALDPKDPFAAQDQTENDRLVAIARSFDSKYGLQHGKRNHASMFEDFVDLGEGYEEDSFVDNSEAYDELVPSTMKTKYGGFYINSGELDFVPVEENSTDGQILKKKIKKRKVIESDVEEVSGLDKKKKLRKKRENGCDESLKKKQKKTNADDGKRCKGSPGHTLKSDTCMTAADFLNEAGLTSNIKAPDAVPFLPVSPVHKNLAPGIDKLVVSSPTHVSQSHSISTDRRADKDANFEPRVEPIATKSEPNISAIESSIVAVILQSREEATSENLKEAGSEMTQSLLPKSIPAELLKTVERMKELALAGKVTSDESSAGHRLTNEAQHQLSEIHGFLSQLEQSDRLAVFNYLGCHFPNGKEGLIKHMKKLDLTLYCDQLKLPIAKLKEAIQTVMPSLIEKHRVEVTTKEKQRLDQLQEQKERREPKDGAAQSDSDDDEENRDAAEKQRRIVAPRKKFEWSNDIRQLLCRVVDIKMKHFEMGKIRSQTPEDYLKSFLEAEIKPLWPPGWIQTRMLFKESRSSHNRWTCNIQKMKKSALAFPKTSAPFVITPLEIPGHSLGSHHHQGTKISFNVPAFIPGTKMKLLLEEALSSNRNKLQESQHHVAYSTSGTSIANGVMEDPAGEILFTSINSKAASKFERETNANNGLDLIGGENESFLQKLKKGLLPKSPVVVHEMENAAKHSSRSKQSNVDKCSAAVEATEMKVTSVLSSADSDTTVVSKAENQPQATFPVDADIVCRLSTNSVQKSTVSAGVGNSFATQSYHDEGMGVPSKRPSQAGCSEGSPIDSARSSLHGQGQLYKADNTHDLGSYQLPNTSHIDQIVRLTSGKSSNATSVGLGLAAQDSTARFTEICSLQRQPSSDANGQVHQKPGTSSSLITNSGGVELQTASASPASRRIPSVSPQRLQQESSSASSLAQSPSGSVLPKAPSQGIYKMVSPARQKAAVTSLGNSVPKWSPKTTSSSAWTVTMAADDTPKFATPVSKTVSCSRITSGNVVATVSSSGHKPRPSTFRAVASTDKSTVARVASSQSDTASEEAIADAVWCSNARQNSQNEDSSKATMFEELLQRIPLESWPIVLESCLNSQELNRAMTAEARLFDTGSSSKLTKRITHDHLYPIHGKAVAAKTTAQSWRPSDKVQTVSSIRGTSPSNTGFAVGQQCNKNLRDRTPEYSQQQFVKTSLPSSSHDNIQIPGSQPSQHHC